MNAFPLKTTKKKLKIKILYIICEFSKFKYCETYKQQKFTSAFYKHTFKGF